MSKRKRKMLLSGIIACIIATIIGMFILFQSDKILIKFNIKSLTNVGNNFTLKFGNVKAADYYKIDIYDSSNSIVYENEYTTNTVDFTLDDLSYQEEYSLMVYAYDSLGNYKPANKEYKFTYTSPSFNEENSNVLNNKDYTLKIDGDLNNNYILRIVANKETKDYKLDTNEFKLDTSIYKDKSIKLEVSILSNNTVIDTINLYNNMNPLSDVVISSPIDKSTVSYEDLTLKYNEQETVENYTIEILKDNKTIKKVMTTKTIAVLSKELFDVGLTYTIKVTARYGEYTKESKVTITFKEQVKLNPVYISSNNNYVTKGTKIELKCPDENAKIYYTTDGKNPESFGKLYDGPIEINKNITLKTVAVLEGYENSIVKTYDINVGTKTNLKVYLSPSNQGANLGVSSTGYTTEKAEMNDLSNYIQERLESYGVKVYRNNPSGNINLWNKESNYAGVDLHIAIHSNASNNHDTYGVETWIDAETSKTYSLAHLIQDDLMSIYPNNTDEKADRGVKYANGALGEVNDNYLTNGILVEVAHHDYESDAEWIMQNKKLIGYNIADSILKYYQIIE